MSLDQEDFYGLLLHHQNIYLLLILEKKECQGFFDDIWMSIRFIDQPDERSQDTLHKKYGWQLADDFVTAFNNHKDFMIIPSDWICEDESMSRWYGHGDLWVNLGFPMYIAIDQKPENGCDIQKSACSRSSVMLRNRLVKTVEEYESEHTTEEDDRLINYTQVLKTLVASWANNNRTMCADSYLASIDCSEELKKDWSTIQH